MDATTHTADSTEFMHMQDILTYIVFSGHHSFITMLIQTMTNNIAQDYAAFPAVAARFQSLDKVLANPEFAYQAKVVVFFFFLSIDYKVHLCHPAVPSTVRCNN